MAYVGNDDYNQNMAQWEEVDVTFPSVANTDIMVQHTMTPRSPEVVKYIPIRKAQAADVYHDASPSRKAWGQRFIFLRSNVANAKVTLVLFIGHEPNKKPAF